MIPSTLSSALGSELGGVFYLHGDDSFRKQEAARALARVHLDPATRDFNLDRLRGSELQLETLASAVGTPPMMAEWRVVLVSEVEALAGSRRTRDFLVQTAASPPPGLALILLCTVPPRSSARFYRDLARSARSLEFRPMAADDLPGWLMEWARERYDRALEEEAARALVMAVGDELAVLAQELAKLDAVAGDEQSISLEHVEKAGTRVPRQDRWGWFDLVGHRRFDKALDGLKVLLDHGESGVGLTIGLAGHFLRLGLASDGGRRALEEVLPRHQRWLGRKLSGQAGRWSPQQVEGALEGLLQVDRLLKSSRLSERHHLESWLLELAAEEDDVQRVPA